MSNNAQQLLAAPVVENGSACAKMGRKGKCCLGCCICSVIVAAVLIPILILVVVPGVAQSILDHTVVALPNSTLSPCTGLASWAQNSALLTVPGPLIGRATIHPYTQEVWTRVCSDPNDFACPKPQEVMVGHYLAPKVSLSQGSNIWNFSARMVLADASIVMNGIVVPSFIMGSTVPLILKAKDISISTLGLTISGLTMRNEVTCSAVATLDATDIPNEICHPDDLTATQDNEQSYELSCVAGLATTATTATAKLVAV